MAQRDAQRRVAAHRYAEQGATGTLATDAVGRLRERDRILRGQVLVGAEGGVGEERVAAVHGDDDELRKDVARPQVVEDRGQPAPLPELMCLEQPVQHVDDRVRLRPFGVGRRKVHGAGHLASQRGRVQGRGPHLCPQRRRAGHGRDQRDDGDPVRVHDVLRVAFGPRRPR